jgi:hypothetical protein
MAEPLGFAHYRDSYTDDELWDMLVSQGNPQSVNLSTSIWSTARGSTAGARESLNAHLTELAEYWKGPASDEFQRRMLLVGQYSEAAEQRMALAETEYLPGLAEKLSAAQSRAKGENALGESLDPSTDITDAEVWMEEVKGLSREQIAALDPQTRTTYNNQHASWRQARHDELAQTVADLGAEYNRYTTTVFAEPAEPAPDGMPGNDTYQQPTTGVFAPTTVNSDAPATVPGGSTSPQPSEPPLIDDEDDVANPWQPPSYTDIDEPSGGLASGPTPSAPIGGAGPVGGTPVAGGGGTLPAGGGLFGPGRPNPGTGGLPGRGPATTGPTRGSQPATPGRNGQPGTPGRGTSGRTGSTTGRGSQPGTPGRTGGTGNSGRNSQPGTPSRGNSGRGTGGRGSGTRAGTGSGVGKNGSPGANSKRRSDEVEEEETLARESKYVQAEDIFSAPFDPAVGPAQEGAKHQRAWNKEYDAWKRRQEEEDGDSDRPDRKV